MNPAPKLRKNRFYAWRVIGVLCILVIGLTLLTAYGFDRFVKMPGETYTGPIVPLKTEEERTVARNLRHNVTMQAEVLGERNLTNAPDRLAATEAWVAQELEQSGGLKVTRLPYTVGGAEVANIEGVKLGKTHPEEIVIIGAHYDSEAHTRTPGANDNGSGVAAMLELARLTRGSEFGRTVRFVAFTNEEPPYFRTDDMGSRVYALACKRAGEKITGMLCLETMGYFTTAPNSQKYPEPLDKLFPSVGNFIALVGNENSRDFVHQCIGTFRAHAKIGSEGIAAPEGMHGVGFSDHASFWEHGYPALMITDTAMYRYPYYHHPKDLPDQLNYEQMTHVVTALVPVIDAIALRVPKP